MVKNLSRDSTFRSLSRVISFLFSFILLQKKNYFRKIRRFEKQQKISNQNVSWALSEKSFATSYVWKYKSQRFVSLQMEIEWIGVKKGVSLWHIASPTIMLYEFFDIRVR